MMTWREEKKLHDLVCWRNRRYRSEPDFEDIVSEGLILAWINYQRNQGMREDRRFALAVAASRYAYTMYLRRWYGRKGKMGNEIREPLPVVPIEMAEAVAMAPFEPAVIERVDAYRIWARWQSICSPRQAQVVEGIIWRGESFLAVSRRIGIDERDAWRYYKTALAKCRTAWGVAA